MASPLKVGIAGLGTVGASVVRLIDEQRQQLALRSGRPMLAVPWSHDQPDNAERLRKLGVSRTIERSRYTAAKASEELDRLLNEPSYKTAAAQIARELAKEDGLGAACNSLEAALSNQSTLLAD